MSDRSTQWIQPLAIGGVLVLLLLQLATLTTQDLFWEFLLDGDVYSWLAVGLYASGAVAIALLGAARLRGVSLPLAPLVLIAGLPLAAALAGIRTYASGFLRAWFMHVSDDGTLIVGAMDIQHFTLLGVLSTGSLLACLALVVSLDGLRTTKSNFIASLTMAGLGLLIAAATISRPFLFVATLPLLAVLLAAAVAGSPERSAACAVIGIVVATLTLHQIRVIDTLEVLRTLPGLAPVSQIEAFDRSLVESAQRLSYLLLLAPLAMLAVPIAMGRKQVQAWLRQHSVDAGVSALLLGLIAASAAGTNAPFESAIETIAAASSAPAHPATVTLPRVAVPAQPAQLYDDVVVLDTHVHKGSAVLGDRTVLRRSASIRGAFDGGPLLIFADESVTAGELYGLLEAATRDERTSVEVVVASEPRPSLHGPLQNYRFPPAVIAFEYDRGDSTGAVRAHIAREATFLHRESNVRAVTVAELRDIPEVVVSADIDVPLALVLDAIASTHERVLQGSPRLVRSRP